MTTYSLVADHRRHLYRGADPVEALRAARAALAAGDARSLLLFDDATGNYTDVDGAGSDDEILARLQRVSGEEPKRTGPGRPKLGVVPREVSLLPRHWEWLNTQPGGASAALRRLVEDARKTQRGKDEARQAMNAAYRFMSLVGASLPGFEEASRALFAGDAAKVEVLMKDHGWPVDVAAHLGYMLQGIEGELA